MSYELCDKIKNLVPYEPGTGSFDIKMDANESFVNPTDDELAFIEQAVRSVKLNLYPDPQATALKEAFASAYGINAANVTAGNGSDELISLLCGAFMMPGENAMVIEPDFSMYRFYLTLAGCNVTGYKKDDDFRFDADDMIRRCNAEHCRMLIFSNPCNPTSLGLDRNTVRKIITGVNALVVLDEAYMDFWDQSLIDEITQYDNAILLRTCSKMLGLAALRVGFAVANDKLTAALSATKSPYNVNAWSQSAAAGVLSHGEILERAVRKITVSRNELYLLMDDLALSKKIKVYETCTNFVTVKVDNAPRVFEELKRDSILVRNFGDFLRITACKKAQNRALFESLLKIL